MNWLYYLAEANVYLGVFYLAYCLFLSKETYYQLNRAYLLFSCAIAFTLPVLQIGRLKPVETVVATTISYTIPTNVADADTTVAVAPIETQPALDLHDYLWYAYLIGVAILLTAMLIKFYALYKLLYKSQRIKQSNHKLVYLPETDVAFSFFNYLFIGTNARSANTIIRHELVHINQKHSVDIIFMEIVKIISWFNPCVYLLQNSLKTIHEYIADEQTAAYETDALTYSAFLVNNAYGAGGSSITHSFFNYNLLKKRIIMLNQQRSGNLARLKYLLAVPICAGLLCASTLAFSKSYAWIDIAPANTIGNEPAVTPAIATIPALTAVKANNTDVPPPPPPIPSLTMPGYHSLGHHVMKNVFYNLADNKKGVFTVLSFDLKADGILSNIKIDKSAGGKFDNQALNAFRTFNLPVKDKPGHKTAVVVFYNGQNIADMNAFTNKPDCVGSWVISGDWPYKVSKTAKGYEYDQYAEYLNNVFNYRTVFYEADGKVAIFNSNKATAADVKLLKAKYDYSFPPVPQQRKVSMVTFPPPSVINDGYMELGKYLTNTLRYRNGTNKRTGALVEISFDVTADKKITDAKVAHVSGGTLYGNLALKAFNSYTGTVNGTAGTHTFLINFFYGGNTSEQNIVISSSDPTRAGTVVIVPTAKAPIIDQVKFPPPIVRPDAPIPAKPKVDRVKFLPPVITPDDDKTPQQQFYAYLRKVIRYPALARENNIIGKVYAVFSVDDNHDILYAKIVRTPSPSLGQEVLRVLKTLSKVTYLKPGEMYTIPITFALDGTGPAATAIDEKQVDLNYNPKSIPAATGAGLMLNEVVIVGYRNK